MFLYYQPDKFPFTLQKLETKGQPRSITFWIPFVHQSKSPYSYFDFIDLFVHPVMEMLIGSPPPRINLEIKGSSNFPSRPKWVIGTFILTIQKLVSTVA